MPAIKDLSLNQLYQILGIPVTEDISLIISAHRKKIESCHPALYIHATKAERMERLAEFNFLNSVKEVLVNPESRRAHHLEYLAQKLILKFLKSDTKFSMDVSVNYAYWIKRCIKIVLEIKSFDPPSDKQSTELHKLNKRLPEVGLEYWTKLLTNDQGWGKQGEKYLLFSLMGLDLIGLSVEECQAVTVKFISGLYATHEGLKAASPAESFSHDIFVQEARSIWKLMASRQRELSFLQENLTADQFEDDPFVSLSQDYLGSLSIKKSILTECYEDYYQFAFKLKRTNPTLAISLEKKYQDLKFYEYKRIIIEKDLPGAGSENLPQVQAKIDELQRQINELSDRQAAVLKSLEAVRELSTALQSCAAFHQLNLNAQVVQRKSAGLSEGLVRPAEKVPARSLLTTAAVAIEVVTTEVVAKESKSEVLTVAVTLPVTPQTVPSLPQENVSAETIGSASSGRSVVAEGALTIFAENARSNERRLRTTEEDVETAEANSYRCCTIM